jgi:hypothetical protein
MFYVSLPGAPSEIPKGLEGLHHLALLKTTTAVQMQQIAGSVSAVSAVLAGKNTPAELQDMAASVWPDATVYRYLGERQWSCGGEPKAVVAATADDTVFDVSADAARDQAGKYVFEYYRLHSWGKDKQRVEIARLEGAFGVLLQQHSELQSLEEDLRKAASQGNEACRLIETLKQKLATEGEESARAWLDRVGANTAQRIADSLTIALKKASKYKLKSDQKRQASKGFKPSIPAVMLENGRHPHAIQNLEPSPQWTVLIDESGTHFGAEVDQLGDADKDIGRMVALLLPQGCSLPPLKEGFHAAEEATDVIERVLADLMKASVGILGFTSKDSLTGRYSWFEKVEQLVRWVLLLLPINSQQPLKVRVMIENRSDYTPGINLGPMAELITADLMRLNAGRYQSMQLSMAIISKEGHAANGYVDTLANCWGSNMADKRKLLNLCQLPGYCLIRPSDDAMYERLLFALESGSRLRPADWYQLQQEGGDYLDSANSLVSACMEQLGLLARADQGLWQRYLSEVQQRLRSKDFRLAGLGRALVWLEQFAPQATPLPDNLRLRLLAARLAHQNHLGRCDLALVGEALSLANSLRDEMAPEACELVLRIAVSASNAFDFRCCEPVIDEWLALPVATVGLLNQAKLHSTKGQLLAFQGRNVEADACFMQARLSFDRLADQSSVRKDTQQSRTYQLFARLCNPAVGEADLRSGLENYLMTVPGKHDRPLFERLARSGQVERFAHQLALRALCEKPHLFEQERQQYLAREGEWQTGEDHPWPLILAYRGWLLVDAGRPIDAAEQFGLAIELCQQADGVTLHWMAAVLSALGASLQLDILPVDAAQKQRLVQVLPKADHAALTELFMMESGNHNQRLILLERCLPFNFH